MFGLSRQRLLLYGVALVSLIALNVWNWQSQSDKPTLRPKAEALSLAELPSLNMADDFSRGAELGTRDLFSRRPLAEVAKPVVAAEPVRKPPPADPHADAIAQARRALGDMKLLGVMSAGEGSLAVLYFNGNTTNRAVGDEVVPGFFLDRITRDDAQLSNQSAGISAILTIGGRKPLQLIRVE